MPVTDAARCYACRRPRLPADPFAAELKKLAIPYVIFAIEMQMDNSLPYLRAATRNTAIAASTEGLLEAANFAAPAQLVLTLPNAFDDISAQGRASQHVNTFPVDQDSSTDMFSAGRIRVDDCHFEFAVLPVLVPVFWPRSTSTSPLHFAIRI